MRTNFSAIVAIDSKSGMATDTEIPWYYSEDFKYFKSVTTSKAVVMGVNTYTEINAKLQNATSVLPNRKCYVISRTLESLPNAIVVRSLNDIPEDECFVIGGARLYEESLAVANTVYVTQIAKDYNCNVFFNTALLQENFTLRTEVAGNDPDLTFQIWHRH